MNNMAALNNINLGKVVNSAVMKGSLDKYWWIPVGGMVINNLVGTLSKEGYKLHLKVARNGFEMNIGPGKRK